jgi:hypothetical protein
MGAVEGKGLVGGGSGEAGTAMQMQGLSAVTPYRFLVDMWLTSTSRAVKPVMAREWVSCRWTIASLVYNLQ